MFDTCNLQNMLGEVPAAVMKAVVTVESGHNPFAIGVVGDRLVRQPKSLDEAVVTAKHLASLGKNYSVGLSQLNKSNFSRFGVSDVAHAFDACHNLKLGAQVLAECYSRSGSNIGKALSCYYSGNFDTGFKHGYVQRVLAQLGGIKKTSLLAQNLGEQKSESVQALYSDVQTALEEAGAEPSLALRADSLLNAARKLREQKGDPAQARDNNAQTAPRATAREPSPVLRADSVLNRAADAILNNVNNASPSKRPSRPNSNDAAFVF